LEALLRNQLADNGLQAQQVKDIEVNYKRLRAEAEKWQSQRTSL
jgi:hypothetical protein